MSYDAQHVLSGVLISVNSNVAVRVFCHAGMFRITCHVQVHTAQYILSSEAFLLSLNSAVLKNCSYYL